MKHQRSSGTPKEAKDTFRPPVISYAIGGSLATVAVPLYISGQSGWEIGSLLALVSYGAAIYQVAKGMKDNIIVTIHHITTDRFMETKDERGKSRFANIDDINNCPDISKNTGVFAGEFEAEDNRKQSVCIDCESSISVVSPSGGNKSTAIVTTTAFVNAAPNIPEKFRQDFILNDPSGEIYSICGPALEAAGYELVVLAPFQTELSEMIGKHVRDSGLNIFSSIHPDMDPAKVRSQLLLISQWVMPGRVGMGEKDQYFLKYGRMLFCFLALHLMVKGKQPTLPEIRRLLMAGAMAIGDLFQEAEDLDALGGVYQELARTLGGMLKAAPQQFAGGYGIAEQALDIFDHGSAMGHHTSGSSFNPLSLKNPNKKVAIFICYGIDKMEAYAAPIAMTLTYLFDTIAADKQAGKVTAIIDECGSLNMPKLASSLNFYRKAGLRCVMIWQDFAQAEHMHGKSGLRQILAASKYKIAMGLQEPESLKEFSRLCGTKSVTGVSMVDNGLAGNKTPALSPTVSSLGEPLFREEEIRQMSNLQLLLVGGTLPPVILNKVCYWQRPEWDDIAGPSPYHRD